MKSSDLPYLSDEQKIWFASMRSILLHNVPRFITHIKQRGGVNKEEWEWIQCDDEKNPNSLRFILDRADDYLLYPKPKDFKKSLFILVRGLAIMSFISGGIRLLGLRFDSEIQGFAEIEEVESEA